MLRRSTIVWAGIIAFAIAMYVVMDGFDLGIGILFTRFKVGTESGHGHERHRSGMGWQ